MQIHEEYTSYLADMEQSIITNSSTNWSFLLGKRHSTRIPGDHRNGDGNDLMDSNISVNAFADKFSAVYTLNTIGESESSYNF